MDSAVTPPGCIEGFFVLFVYYTQVIYTVELAVIFGVELICTLDIKGNEAGKIFNRSMYLSQAV